MMTSDGNVILDPLLNVSLWILEKHPFQCLYCVHVKWLLKAPLSIPEQKLFQGIDQSNGSVC